MAAKWNLCYRGEYNNISEIDLSKNIELKVLTCEDINLKKLDVSNNLKLEYLVCSYNNLMFSHLPIIEPKDFFWYSPQRTSDGGTIGYKDILNLSDEYNINGFITTFQWFDITGGTERTITQPQNENGFFTFTEEHKNKRLRCKMQNKYFPGRGVGSQDFIVIYEINISETSIVDTPVATNFSISPNPTFSDAIVNFCLLESDEITLEICDLLGNIIYTTTQFYAADNHSVFIDTKNIPSGNYICRLFTKDKQIGIANFVVGK